VPTRFPQLPARSRSVALYTHPEPGDPRWTNSFDLLFRGLELVTARLIDTDNIRRTTLFPRDLHRIAP
jgi:aspartyl/asparaginyl-tRNA synthetase